MQTVYLICGVPGSGKTWACTQLEDRYIYVPHDDYPNQAVLAEEVEAYAKTSDKPILVDCPFAEREFRGKLEGLGLKIIPIFVVENPTVCRARYEEREQRGYPKNHFTRASSISKRAAEWMAFQGSSGEVLEHLKELSNG